MAVTLPSDLVLDVMRNADPVRSKQVIARLNQGATVNAPEDSFASILKSSDPAGSPDPVAAASSGGVALPLMPGETADPKAKAYSSLEQFMLQDMVETMLPSASSGLFGDQISGGVWRSMTADALSKSISESGGIGLAKMIAARDTDHLPRGGQWPYFGVQQIQSFVTPPATGSET